MVKINGTWFSLAKYLEFLLKNKNLNKNDSLFIYKIHIQGHILFKLKTFYICNLLSLWALSNYCDPFERYISYSHDQDHVHSTYFANFYTGSCASIHKIKIPCYSWLFSPSCKDMGLLKKRENWTHEGPRYSKEKEKKFGHMKVKCVLKES